MGALVDGRAGSCVDDQVGWFWLFGWFRNFGMFGFGRGRGFRLSFRLWRGINRWFGDGLEW